MSGPASPGSRSTRSRVRLSRTAIVALVAATVAAVLTIVTLATVRPFASTTPTLGRVVPIDSTYVDVPRSYRLLLPTSTVELQVGPIDQSVEVGRPATDEPTTLDAGGDGVVVALTWSAIPIGLSGNPTPSASPSARLDLRMGSRSVELGQLGGTDDAGQPLVQDDAGGAAVVVHHPDAPLVLALTFDGVTQTVDLDDGSVEEGRAAALYADQYAYAGPSVSCASAPPARLGYETAYRLPCAVDPVATRAWLPELGWAPQGRVWARTTAATSLVPLRLQPPKFGIYRPTTDRLALRLDGSTPRRVTTSRDHGRRLTVATWEVPTTAPRVLRITRSTGYEPVPGYGHQPAARPVRTVVSLALHRS